ncbi:MAG: hypothetical protein GXO29_00435 [Thermotogae bacterium]|nr:hypothetical protein [Thermotogota bacterium]
MVAPKMERINWILWGLAILSVLVAFYLTSIGEKIISTILFVFGYAVFPTAAILVKWPSKTAEKR